MEELTINPHNKKPRFNLEDNPHPTTTGFQNLPIEITHEILSKLPISSLIQFNSVSKSCRSLTQHPNLLPLYLSSTANQNDPCLIFHCDVPIRNQLYFVDFAADSKGNSKVKRINAPFWPKMPEFDLVGSCNGLLCLADSLYKDAIFIYNPFNSNYLELPKSLNFPEQELVFGFGFNPKSQSYSVVKIIYYRNSQNSGGFRPRRQVYPQSEVQILTIGTTQWRSLGKIPYQLVRRPSEALVNGKLHWVSRPQRYNPSRRIVSFDLGDETFREVPKPECGGLNRCNYHVLVLKGWLSAAVHCSYGRIEIWVMKGYGVKESWVKEISIGGYMPKAIKQNVVERPIKIWKNSLNGKVRVLGVLRNGKVLLEYRNRVVVSYDPNVGKFKDLLLEGTPKWFHAVVHVGSLNWIHT